MGVFSTSFYRNNYKEDAFMRTIKELYSLEGKIYLWLGSTGAFEHFIASAKDEGFSLPIVKDDVLVLNENWSFCHHGFVGHMAFHNAAYVSGKKLIRVDYNKWISDAEDYLYHGDGK